MQSSLSGKSYELVIANMLRVVTTAGCSKHNDIRLGNIDIEVKRTYKAEFGQKKATLQEGVLVVNHPLFQDCIAHTLLWEGRIPPFVTKKIMYPDWDAVKDMFTDEQYHAPSNVISKYYKEKGNSYIQIKGLGLYHTGEDVCAWGVPYFECPTYLRVRCKRHGVKCPLTKKDIPTSVMASFWVQTPPAPSPYSLDSVSTMPERLRSQMSLL